MTTTPARLGPVRFNRRTRVRIPFVMETNFDPAGCTIEFGVDGQWYPATWAATATKTGNTWTRPAETTDYFRGPDATSAGTVLTAGRHLTQTRITDGGNQIVAASTPIDVA